MRRSAYDDLGTGHSLAYALQSRILLAPRLRRLTRSSRLLGENVSPPTWVFHVRVWLSLHNLSDLEARRGEEAFYLLGTEENEVDRDLLSPPLIEVHDVIADVESQEQQAPWQARFSSPSTAVTSGLGM